LHEVKIGHPQAPFTQKVPRIGIDGFVYYSYLENSTAGRPHEDSL